MQLFRVPVPVFFVLLIAACQSQAPVTQVAFQPSSLPTLTYEPTSTQAIPTATLIPIVQSCDQWQAWPVIPVVGDTARQVYERGLAGGNNPRAFSKIGDGEISTEWFLTAFDLGESYYDLGPYPDLRPVIEYFGGSFGRIGISAKRGFNTEKILDPAMSDPKLCESGESPLTCELRLQQPAFAILSLGTNQVWRPEEFERGMRQILETLLSQNVLPIVSTKGDNLEGDHRINHTIACLAQEYDLPLWNFWAAIQPLTNQGLQPDLEHLTYGVTNFGDERAMQSAWTIRNLTALQMLNAIWRGLTARS